MEKNIEILIVDDIKENRALLAGTLNKNTDYSITMAKDAAAMFKALERVSPDLILLDIMMPGMDGFTAAGLLKDNPDTRNIPVIFITALDRVEDKVKAFQNGGIDYITKPFNKDELLARVNAQIKLKQASLVIEEKNHDLLNLTELIKQYMPTEAQEELFTRSKRKLATATKKLAILFSDIRGFTAMSESLPPEEVVGILNRYLYFISHIIVSNGGKIDKFIGDAVLAVFEHTGKRDDPCYRAVKTALEMQAEMTAFNNVTARNRTGGESCIEVKLGIGINYAEVVQGTIGTMDKKEYTVIGDGVNTAQRLESLAGRGEILVSSSVYDRVCEKGRFTPLEDRKVKGKAKPLTSYRLEELN